MATEDRIPRLEAYHFHERDWDGYDDLYENFEFEVPDRFNLATHLVDRWAGTDRTALVAIEPDGVTEYSYGDVDACARRLANYLADRGVEPGDRVAVNGAQGIESLATHLAAWKLGAASMPLSILFGPDALGFRLRDSEATAFVVAPQALPAFRAVADDCPALDTALVVGEEDLRDGETAFHDAVEGYDDDFETADTDAEDDAILIYTSGTTGSPKGVRRPHRGFLGLLPALIPTVFDMDVRDDDVLRTPVEWSWAGSLNDVVMPALFFGLPIVADHEPQFDPEQELDVLERHGVTITGGPPTAFRMLLGHPAAEDADLDLRVLGLGGEAAGQSLIELAADRAPGAAVAEVYGQSEAPLFVGDSEALGVHHREGCMGKPLPGHEVRVFDPETGEECDPGEVGEFVLRYDGNPICFTGYLNRPDATAEKVRDGWMLTEDLGSVDEDGYLRFHSRKDDVIISSGYKVSPAEVEDTLQGHPAVQNAGVVGVPDETRGELVKAFVVLAPDREPSEELRVELQDHVKEHLAKYEYPRALAFVEELPLTTTGKVRRMDLREREGEAG